MKIKLDDVVEALEYAGNYIDTFYHMNTESLYYIADGGVIGDDPEIMKKIEHENYEEFIALPDRYDIHEYGIIEDFIRDETTGIDQYQFQHLIHGKGAFRRFKNQLHTLGIEKNWYDYRRLAYIQIARNWCEIHNIDIIE